MCERQLCDLTPFLQRPSSRGPLQYCLFTWYLFNELHIVRIKMRPCLSVRASFAETYSESNPLGYPGINVYITCRYTIPEEDLQLIETVEVVLHKHE